MPPRRRFVPRKLAECETALGTDFPSDTLRLAFSGQLQIDGDSDAEDGAADEENRPRPLFRLLRKPKSGDWLESHEEPGQSFPHYAKRMNPKNGYSLPRPACDTLLVCPVGKSFSSDVGARFMPVLMRYYAAFFPEMAIKVLEKPLSLKDVDSRENDFGHKQYLIGDIFTLLNTDRGVLAHRNAYSRLGVTLEDIYPGDEWNYVFGQARPMERVGVFSFARHSPLFYEGVHATDTMGSLSSRQMLDWMRTNRKTMVHETCHMFGILHCVYWNCLMNGSNGPGDSAGASFLCPVCLRKLMFSLEALLGPLTPGAIDDRYAGMQASLRSLAEEMDPEGTAAGLRKDLQWLEDRRAQLAEIARCPPPPAPPAEAEPRSARRTVALAPPPASRTVARTSAVAPKAASKAGAVRPNLSGVPRMASPGAKASSRPGARGVAAPP